MTSELPARGWHVSEAHLAVRRGHARMLDRGLGHVLNLNVVRALVHDGAVRDHDGQRLDGGGSKSYLKPCGVRGWWSERARWWCGGKPDGTRKDGSKRCGLSPACSTIELRRHRLALGADAFPAAPAATASALLPRLCILDRRCRVIHMLALQLQSARLPEMLGLCRATSEQGVRWLVHSAKERANRRGAPKWRRRAGRVGTAASASSSCKSLAHLLRRLPHGPVASDKTYEAMRSS
jgi:hypothetical protein